jgi:hypothetical protein
LRPKAQTSISIRSAAGLPWRSGTARPRRVCRAPRSRGGRRGVDSPVTRRGPSRSLRGRSSGTTASRRRCPLPPRAGAATPGGSDRDRRQGRATDHAGGRDLGIVRRLPARARIAAAGLPLAVPAADLWFARLKTVPTGIRMVVAAPGDSEQGRMRLLQDGPASTRSASVPALCSVLLRHLPGPAVRRDATVILAEPACPPWHAASRPYSALLEPPSMTSRCPLT